MLLAMCWLSIGLLHCTAHRCRVHAYSIKKNEMWQFCTVDESYFIMTGKVNVKCAIHHEECRQGTHLPFLGHEPVDGYTTEVCNVWPV